MEQTLEKRHGAKDVVASEVGVLSVVAMFYAICCTRASACLLFSPGSSLAGTKAAGVKSTIWRNMKLASSPTSAGC